MAAADYRLCDCCDGKVFYDSNLNYEYDEVLPSGHMKLDYLGDWRVICEDCAKTHKTVVLTNEQAAALSASGGIAAPAVANGAEDIKDMAQDRRVITQLRAAAGQDAALPDGYVMVPINPTQKMIEASITGSGDRVDGISLARFARAHKAMISALPDAPQASAMDDITKDAERYRWLRDCDWFSSELCVLRDPKQVLTKTGLTLGADCPSRFRLDEAIDKARAALSGAKGN